MREPMYSFQPWNPCIGCTLTSLSTLEWGCRHFHETCVTACADSCQMKTFSAASGENFIKMTIPIDIAIRLSGLQLCNVHVWYCDESWVSGLEAWKVVTTYTDIILFITLRPRQNGRHFADDTLKPIFFNENIRISIKISLKCVPKVPINNIPALVQIMAWRRPGDKPLSEPMMVCLLTHICVTRPQWAITRRGVNRLRNFIAEKWYRIRMYIYI